MSDREQDLAALYAEIVGDLRRGAFTVAIEKDGWWLVDHGRRVSRTPWWPADELDVLVMATLMYQINEAGPVPIEGVFLDVAKRRQMRVDILRDRLGVAAFGLLIRLRTGASLRR